MRQEQNSFISVCFTCGDRDCIDVSVIEVVADPQMYEGSVIGQGSLDAGFDVTVYTDNLYTTPSLVMAIGTTAYVKAMWATPISGVKFCVHKCSYSCGTTETTVDIIKVSMDINPVVSMLF